MTLVGSVNFAELVTKQVQILAGSAKETLGRLHGSSEKKIFLRFRAIRTMLALVGIVLCAKPEITVIQVPNHAGSVRVILKKPKR